jgi:hypothetical protein
MHHCIHVSSRRRKRTLFHCFPTIPLGVLGSMPSSVRFVSLDFNNFSGNALSSLCDASNLVSLSISGLSNICNPFCFDDEVFGNHTDVSYCDNVMKQRTILNEFL